MSPAGRPESQRRGRWSRMCWGPAPAAAPARTARGTRSPPPKMLLSASPGRRCRGRMHRRGIFGGDSNIRAATMWAEEVCTTSTRQLPSCAAGHVAVTSAGAFRGNHQSAGHVCRKTALRHCAARQSLPDEMGCCRPTVAVKHLAAHSFSQDQNWMLADPRHGGYRCENTQCSAPQK